MDRAILEAVADRIVPPDDWPGAVEAGALDYVHRQLAGDLRHEVEHIEQGLVALEAEAQARFDQPFHMLEVDQKDETLADLERGEVRAGWRVDPVAWFGLMVTLVAEGYYADPGNGGNRGGVSWQMIGYSPDAKREVK